MTDLAAFLHARLNEDEATAQDATPGPWTADGTRILAEGDTMARMAVPSGLYRERQADAQYVAHWDPARVLAEVAAKREILRVVQQELNFRHERDWAAGQNILEALALPYASHPDYQPAWAPTP